MRFEEEKTEKNSKIPYIFLAFFAVIIIVNLFYIYLSQKSWRGVVFPDAYRRGLEYNETLKLEEEQKKLGWSVEIQSKDLGDGSFSILVIPRDINKRQIENADVRIEFKKPSQEGEDFIVKFDFEDGVYKSKITFPSKGNWNFGILIQKDNDSYRQVQKVVVRW